MAVVKLNYLPRGMTAQRAAKYYTFRDGPDRAQRVWHTSDGQVALYDAVQAEIAAGAEAYAYTYRVVLSAQAGALGPADYHQVLAGQFARYYFIEHHNTAFPHAHVIGFRTERIKKAELQVLRSRVQEQEQMQRRQHTPGRDRDRGIDGPGGRE